MPFDVITTENIQSYFEYLENIKSISVDLEVINPTHLSEIVNTDEEFKLINLDEQALLEKTYQRLMFLCERILDNEYSLEKYDLALASYFMMLTNKVPNNVMDNVRKMFSAMTMKYDDVIRTAGFWTNLTFRGNYYEYRKPTDEGTNPGSAVENEVSEASGTVS